MKADGYKFWDSISWELRFIHSMDVYSYISQNIPGNQTQWTPPNFGPYRCNLWLCRPSRSQQPVWPGLFSLLSAPTGWGKFWNRKKGSTLIYHWDSSGYWNRYYEILYYIRFIDHSHTISHQNMPYSSWISCKKTTKSSIFPSDKRHCRWGLLRYCGLVIDFQLHMLPFRRDGRL